MKVLLPRWNLGCLGFRFNSGLYIDIYKKYNKYAGLFITNDSCKIWVTWGGNITVVTPETTLRSKVRKEEEVKA